VGEGKARFTGDLGFRFSSLFLQSTKEIKPDNGEKEKKQRD